MPCITLLTDFGDSDEYAGVIKGVILSVAPKARIVDLTHKIAPHDIVQAAYVLEASRPYFPKGTIHTVVVDPGVGSERKIVALKKDGQYFLAPDNGVLSLLLRDRKIEAGVRVENSEFFLPDVGNTFHGRDIFAPVAARLFLGTPMENLGPPVDPAELAVLPISRASVSRDFVISGTVVYIDRFGNLITNVEAKTLRDLCALFPEKTPVAEVGGATIAGVQSSYGSVRENMPLMIFGSRGCLEVAVNRSSASRVLGVEKGTPLRIRMSDKKQGG